MFKFIQLKSH